MSRAGTCFVMYNLNRSRRQSACSIRAARRSGTGKVVAKERGNEGINASLAAMRFTSSIVIIREYGLNAESRFSALSSPGKDRSFLWRVSRPIAGTAITLSQFVKT